MSNQQNGSTPPPESLLLPPPPQLFLPSAPNPALSSSSFAQPHHNSRSQLNKKTLSQASTIAPTSSTGRQSLELVSSNSPFTPITSVFNTPSDRQSAPRSSTSIATSTSTTSLSLPAFSQRNSLADNPVFNSAQLSALRGFVSPNTISSNDFGTWETLLAKHKFPATLTPQDAYDLEIATVSLAIELAANNARTKNFNTLLLHLLTQLRRFDPEECRGIIPGETYNALFLVRAFSKHFVGNLSGEEIHRQFEGPTTIHGDEEGLPSLPPPPTIVDHATVQLSAAKFIIDPDVIVDARPKAEQLLDELLTVIVLLDPNASYSAYEFYLEALNTLIALLSTQIYQSSPNANDNNYFLNILMTKFGGRADALIGTLMKHFVAQKPMPPVSASVVYNAYSYFFSSKPTAATTPDLYPLADRSILLILLLSMQSRSSNETRIKTEPNLRANNWTAACRLGISGLRDENTLSVSMSSSSSSNDKAQSNKSREISFRSLYRIVCQSLSTEEVCLLFYLVMVENEAFRVYVLSRTDPDTLFVPILKMVYETMEGKTNYSHVYILLIMLLLFSQDDILNENIQKIVSFGSTSTGKFLNLILL
ncbi:Dyggve-Melchior-Clausen syndrome protein-domain-containing protein [Jimgerdemannia flammicorona]|uniref:Dymeclin n=1 Tax=Jimgerdemannia flammicorona TaxID=994334 RepID=A0A433D2L9_9FUNG|nr:Dyggve-Melchior-Clausen syndrome protein-domain-containing protein [Jimgerdemannia flammicorona]